MRLLYQQILLLPNCHRNVILVFQTPQNPETPDGGNPLGQHRAAQLMEDENDETHIY
jgi:hypothetical protein